MDGEDQKGCLLGRKAAYELFGSGQAQGLTLYLGQTAYEVRGVLAEDSRRVVVRAGAGEVLDQIPGADKAGGRADPFGWLRDLRHATGI